MKGQNEIHAEIFLREKIFTGAVHGLLAWTTYATIEFLFLTIFSWTIKPNYNYIPLHWVFVSLFIFVVSPVFGSVLGGLSGLGLHIANAIYFNTKKLQLKIFFPACSIFLLILAYNINYVINYFQSFRLSHLPPLSISVLLVLTIVLTIRSSIWFNRLRFFTNPWTVSLLLLGLPWIHRELLGLYSLIFKIGASLAYFIVIVSISLIIQNLLRKFRFVRTAMPAHPSVAMKVVILAFATVTVIGASLFLDQEPLIETKSVMPLSQSRGYPNVIMIIMDTVRADHLSVYGYARDTTPNLKKLSEESTLYSQAIAPGNMTLSTHGSIFTGLYPSQHGAHFALPDYPNGRPLAEQFQTLAEILSERGYSTIGVVSNNTFLANTFRLNQGFQYYDFQSRLTFFPKVPKFFLSRRVIDKISTLFSPEKSLLIFRRAEDINIEVLAHLDRVSASDTPFFLFINYMDAHWPYLPPHPFNTLYPGRIEGLPNLRHSLKIRNEVLKCQRKPTEEERNHRISQYDGGIAYIDFHIGKLIERLKELGLYKESLIIISSDHGEAFGDRYLIEHGTSLYEDQIHVPLIVKHPKLKRNRVINKPVSIVDLKPFILDALQIQILDKATQGSNLVNFSLDSKDSNILFSEHFPAGWLFNTYSRFQGIEKAIYSDSFKLISSTTGKRELYDLQKDPGEEMNLYKLGNPISDKLEKILNHWAENETPKYEPLGKIDEEAFDRLKTLGYIH